VQILQQWGLIFIRRVFTLVRLMHRRRILFGVAGVLLISGIILLFWLRFHSQRSEAGFNAVPVPATGPVGQWTIDSPEENASVPRRFQAAGRCGSLAAGSHVILVVQTGRVLSPKIPPVNIEADNWSGPCNEFGVAPGGGFTLCLYAIPGPTLQEISEWHANGAATGSFPPFRMLSGGTLLAKVNLYVAIKGR